MMTPQETQQLVNNLMAIHGVTDIDSLFNVPAVKEAVAAKGGDAPGANALDARVRALNSLRFQTEVADVPAHVVDPTYEDVFYNKDPDNKGWQTKAIGVQVAIGSGTKFVKYADYDADETIETNLASAGLPGDLKPGQPVMVTGVTKTTDLATGQVKTRLSSESSVEPTAHDEPINAEALSLEYAIGQTALDKGYGAWKRDKKFGTYAGEFGSIDGNPQAVLLTISDDVSDFKLDDYSDDPADHKLKVKMVDAFGNEVTHKFPLEFIEENFGITGDQPEAFFELAGQRVLGRVRGSIFWPLSVDDLEGVDFDETVDQLIQDGYLIGYGTKGNVRLNLADKDIVDDTGNVVGKEDHVEIGGVKVYNIVQKGADTDNPRWELSVLAAERGGCPWISGFESHWDNGEQSGISNRNAFIHFLDNDASAGVPDSDPLKQLLMDSTQSSLRDVTPEETVAEDVGDSIPYGEDAEASVASSTAE